MELSTGWILACWTLFGLFVGSFLNVAIHRYPLAGQTVSNPRRSHCPQCGRELTWLENVPLLSWLALRGRCRGCDWPIPWRYPLVEALTGGLWLLAAWSTGIEHPALILARVLVISGLIVATFVDLDCFEIPDSVSIGGMVLAPLLSFLVPGLHADTWIAREMSPDPAAVERFWAFTASLAGMASGGGVLIAIGWLGARIFGKEAMGFGDVKLLAAGGGFLGPGGVLVALMMASVVASVGGVLNMARFFHLVRSRARARGGRRSFPRALRVARSAGRYVPFGPYLAVGIGIVLLYWNDVIAIVLRARS